MLCRYLVLSFVALFALVSALGPAFAGDASPYNFNAILSLTGPLSGHLRHV